MLTDENSALVCPHKLLDGFPPRLTDLSSVRSSTFPTPVPRSSSSQRHKPNLGYGLPPVSPSLRLFVWARHGHYIKPSRHWRIQFSHHFFPAPARLPHTREAHVRASV
eukprot:875691-Prorocentrum_minimum.AAC.3